MRKQNRLRILQAFRHTHSLSRTQLAKATGLSPGTITNITTRLLAQDILITAETDADPQTRHGRPQVQLALNPTRAGVVHGSLTFGRLTLVYSDYAGTVLATRVEDFMTDVATGTNIANRIAEAITRLIPTDAPAPTPDVISIGMQGTTTKERDAILWSPILTDSSLQFPQELHHLTDTAVIIENDCAMIARALNQRQKGAQPTFGAVLMSYGIGMGLQLDGKPFLGDRSSATEFGHLPYRPGGAQCRCGKQGCIEAYASDYAIWRAARGMAKDRVPTNQITPDVIEEIVKQAKRGDGPERDALREAARALGIGLATMFTLFDPFPVVFIGPGSSFISLLEDDLRSSLRENFRFKQRPHLSFQTEADEIALIEQGACIAALDQVDQDLAFNG